MSENNSSTSIFPAKVFHLSDRRKDNYFRRNGFERLTYRGLKPRDEFLHAYRGQFVRDNYHGEGQYCELHRRKGNTLIDGMFYCNNVEGYASETTSDGGYFEGLFKENVRFGPGVMTYKDNTQDVGLWRGDNLSRLIVVVQSHVIPKLAVTPQGKSILIQYRQLVELGEFNQEARMYTLLKNDGAPQGLLQKYQRLCNKTCRNKDSLLFDTKLYDQKYFGQKDNYINVVMNEQDVLDKERIELEGVEADELRGNTADVVAEETIAELLDCVMEEVGGPSGNHDFAKGIIYQAMECMEDHLERAQDERDLINQRNTHRRFLKQQYSTSFDKTNMKKVPITHLVTWNNETIAVDMLKHSFLHRNSEDSVNFNVCRVLAGDRSDFYSAGVQERKCIDFLVNCSLGLTDEVSCLYLVDRIDVGVVDGRGNSSVHYAAANDKLEMIQLLTNFGAKLDCVNDEHLTAFNMCLLRYLGVLYDVSNWENAFLIDNKVPGQSYDNILEIDSAFNPNSSLLNVLSQISINRNENKKKSGHKKSSLSQQLDIVSMTDILLKLNVIQYSDYSSCQIVEGLEVEQDFVITDKLVQIKPKLKKMESPSEFISPPNSKLKQLNNIYATISVLLYYGAKPFDCNVPLPAVHLAVYTQNPALVKLMLANGSDVNMTLDDLNVAPIHIAATLPTSDENYQLFKLLLTHSADVNIKTNSAHWPDETKIILANYNLVDDTLQKNTLHIIAMRYDHPVDTGNYLVEMARDLIDAKIDICQLYLGHSALSLCLLRGNLVLAQFLVEYLNVGQQLGCQMGTALTVLILKRYQNFFTKEKAVLMIDLLISSGANPFEKIPDFGNTFDFINNEYSVDKNVQVKKEHNDNKDIIQYIFNVSKDILIRKIQISIVIFFIQYHSTKQPFTDFTSHLAHFLNYKEFIEIVQKLIFISAIKPCPCLKPFLIEIGTYINQTNAKHQTELTKDQYELVQNLNFEKPSVEILKNILQLPEYDSMDEKMFDVCFYCLQKLDKYLISCPGCGVVLFCSEQCNKADAKSKNNLIKRHRCNDIFYTTTKQTLFQAKMAVDNKFKQFQQMFNKTPPNRTTCLLGKNHLSLSPLNCTSTIDSKMTSTGDSCKKVHANAGNQRTYYCKSRASTATELSTCAYSNPHLATKSDRQPVAPPPPKKLSLMENLLKSISNRTATQTSTNPSKISTDNANQVAASKQSTNDSLKPINNSHKFQSHRPNTIADIDASSMHGFKKGMKVAGGSTSKKELRRRKRGGKVLNPILPRSFSMFFDTFAKMFPDFDLTTLLLPYACYSNGQLYYRFLDKQPIFMETYSNL